jgi:hypothetical protein
VKLNKSLAILGVALVAVLFASVASSATVWHTYRNDITVPAATCDLDIVYYHNGTTTEVYRNITLPCNIMNLTTAVWNITGDGGVAHFNLSVNGVMCNNSGNYTDGVSNLTTLAQMETAGVDNTSSYLNFTFNASAATNDIAITITVDDGNITTWLASNMVIKEKDVSTPNVGPTLAGSYWAMNNSCNVSHTIGYTLTDFNITITYPSHSIGTPTPSNFRMTTIANDSYLVNYTQYQKRGPYVYTVEEDISSRTHTVTVKLKSDEVLTNCVDWDLITTHSVYNDYFDTLSYSTLDIYLNGHQLDDDEWEQGSISMEDITVLTTFSSNEWEFVWTVAVAAVADGVVAPVAGVEFLTSEIGPFPMWLVIVFAGVLIVAGIAIWKKW